MFHYINNFEDLATGKVVTSIRMRVLDPVSGDQIAIYADENGTPYTGNDGVETVTASVNPKGRVDFWVTDGSWDLEILGSTGEQIDYIRKINMVGDITPDAQNARDEAQASAAAALVSEIAAAASAEAASVAADLVDDAAALIATGTVSDLIGMRIYASRALLNADLVPADNLYALVIGDATAGNNDLYQKNGATTTGSWDGPLGFFAAASSLANAAAAAATVSETNAAASAAAAVSAIAPMGGSIRFPDNNMSQFPRSNVTPETGIADVQNRGFLTQSFGAPSTPFIRFAADCAFMMALEIPWDLINLDPQYYLAGDRVSSGLGWGLTLYGGDFSKASATNSRFQRRFQFFIGCTPVSTNYTMTCYSRQVPLTWKKVAVVIHRNSNVFRIDVWNVETGAVLVGTGTDNALFAAELSSTNANINLNRHATSGSVPTMFGIGAIITTDVTNLVQLNAPASLGYSPCQHGLILYADELVSDADVQAIMNGAHPTTVITAANIKYKRALTLDPATWAKDPLCTGDTSVAATSYGRIFAGGSILRVGTANTATVASAPRARYVYGLRPGQVALGIEMSGTCTVTADSFIDMRILDETGDVVVDWRPVAAVSVGDTTWSKTIAVPKHHEWLMRQIRVRGSTAVFTEASRFGVGYKFFVHGQSQVANGIGVSETSSGTPAAAYFKKQYYGLPANLIYTTGGNFALGAPQHPVTWPLGQNIGHDQYKSMAAELNRWLDAPFEIVVYGVGGTGPTDLMNNGVVTGVIPNMWTKHTELVAYAGAVDFSGYLDAWWTDLRGLGGLYGEKAMEGYFLGRGPYLYTSSDTGYPQRWVLEPFADGTPIFYMPMTRHNDIGVGPNLGGSNDYDLYEQGYNEAINQAGALGATRDSGQYWAARYGLPVSAHPIDIYLRDEYHPDLGVEMGGVRFGKHMALACAAGMGLARFTNPTVKAGSFAFTDGTRNAFRFKVTLPNMGRLRSGDGTGVVTPCIQVSSDGGTTWTRSGFTAVVYNGDGVEVTKLSGAWGTGLMVQVLKGGPFGWGLTATAGVTRDAQILACNVACTDNMLYEELDILTDAPGLCVTPSQTIHTVAG